MTQAESAADAEFKNSQTAAMLIIGVMSGFVPALQPLLLGELASEGRITLAEIGQAAMLEAFGMALAACLAGAGLKAERLRLIAVISIVAGLAVNLATPRLSGTSLVMLRAFGGISAGMLLWLWIGMVARSSIPARLVAIYVSVQAASQLALSSLFASFLLPWGGSTAGYGALAVLYGGMLILVRMIPNSYRPIGGDGEGLAIPSGVGLVGDFAVLFHLAAIMALWVYIVPLAQQAGLPEGTAPLAISIGLAAEILAGIVAGVIGVRLNAFVALIGSIAISTAAIALLAIAQTPLMFIVGVVIFAFFWMFAMPFQMPYLITLDPTRKAAMQVLTAQLLGLAAGPAIASFMVGQQGAIGAAWASGGLYILTGTIIFLTMFRRPAAASA